MTRKSCALPSVAVFCLLPALALAAPRTFVGATGTDNPACSLPAPCRTFSAAIAATSDKGEIIVLDSAGYGSVTITKSVSIIAPPGIYAGISVLSGNGVTINAPGATVVLRGLTINGQGGANGILSLAAARVRVESCVVSDMGAVGIYHQAATGEMIVLDTIVRDNADGIGLVAANYASITLDHVRSEHNAAVGFYMAPSAGGVRAAIADSLFAYNGTYGIWADSLGSSTTSIVVERSTFFHNASHAYHATAAASGAIIRAMLSRNTFDTPVYILGTEPAETETYAIDNALTNGSVFATGSGNSLYVNRNTGPSFAWCEGGGKLVTFGNNDFEVISAGCTLITKGGQ